MELLNVQDYECGFWSQLAKLAGGVKVNEGYAAAAAAKSLQSCLTLCDPIDDSPPGSPVPGILQARTDGETMETMTDFVFLGSKITAVGGCSHEIKKDTCSLEEKL